MVTSAILQFAVKAVSAGLLVVIATRVAERAGPFWGALIAALPLSAGPIYAFVALQHGDAFIANVAAATLAGIPATAAFVLAIALITPKAGAAVAIATGGAVWFLIVGRFVGWASEHGGLMLLAAGALICGHIATEPVRRRPAKLSAAARWYDMPARAALVGLLVASVSGLSGVIGPAATGYAAVFPVVMISMTIILKARLGGEAVAITMASTFLPLVGFSLALMTVLVTAVPIGKWNALALGLAVNIAWSALLGLIRYRGLRTAARRASA